MKTNVKRLIRDQRGGAYVLVLVLLIVGGLIIAPVLGHMGTGIIAGGVHEKRMDELYAADAGVEDAIWRIKDGIGLCPNQSTSYNISDVNDKSVEVTVTYVDSSTYRINSIATTGNGNTSTEVECYVQVKPGANLPIFDGALVSEGDITLRDEEKGQCKVRGDIWLNGTLDAPELDHEEGSIQYGGVEFPSQEENEAFAQQLADEAKAGGTYTGTYTIPAETTVNIYGLYIDGDLIIQKECIFILHGTIYVTGDIEMDKESVFSGSGNIIAEGAMTLAKEQEYGTEGASIIMSLNGDITFAKEVEMESSSLLVYAPNGTIEFAKESVITGSVVGANLVSGKEGSFTYIPDSGDWGQLPGALPGEVTIKTYNIDL